MAIFFKVWGFYMYCFKKIFGCCLPNRNRDDKLLDNDDSVQKLGVSETLKPLKSPLFNKSGEPVAPTCCTRLSTELAETFSAQNLKEAIFTAENGYSFARDALWGFLEVCRIGLDAKETDNSISQNGAQSIYTCVGLVGVFAITVLVCKYWKIDINLYKHIQILTAASASIPAWNFAYDASKENFVDQSGYTIIVPCLFSGLASGAAEVLAIATFDAAKAVSQKKCKGILNLKNTGKFLGDLLSESSANFAWQATSEASINNSAGKYTAMILADLGTRTILTLTGKSLLKLTGTEQNHFAKYTCNL